MGKIIAVYNQAGGVGKTSVCQNTAAELAARGCRVLLVDLDPQADLTSVLGVDALPQFKQWNRNIGECLLDDNYLEEGTGVPVPIMRTDSGIDIVPCTIEFAQVTEQLVSKYMRETRLRVVLKTILDNYDYILLDCNPSINVISTMALSAADGVIVPLETSYKGMKSTQNALRLIKKVEKGLNASLKIIAFVPNEYDSRRTTDKEAMEYFNSELPRFAPTLSPIPTAIAIRNAQKEALSLREYEKGHAANAVFARIADCVEEMNLSLAAN